MKFIDFRVFIISLAFGLFLSYVTSSSPNVIYVYPTPDNLKQIQYEDEGGTCYNFTSSEVKCPSDNSKIRKYPVQKINEDLNQ
tara:strand:- start:16 stop:264 length:249 start_codon:yes stop_codon:yes gene_type:complete